MLVDRITSLDAQTTGTGSELACTGFDRVGWVVVWNGTTSAGTVIIEWAETSGYSGTWKQLASLSAASNTVDGSVADTVGGFVRARLSANVTGGGTVTVYLKRQVIGHY